MGLFSHFPHRKTKTLAMRGQRGKTPCELWMTKGQALKPWKSEGIP